MNRQNSSHNKDDSSNKIAAFIAALGALLVSVEVLSNFLVNDNSSNKFNSYILSSN